MNKELLHRYFMGEASESEEKQIMDWAEASPENYHAYLRERKWWDALLVHSDQVKASQTIRPKRTVNLWLFSTIAASIALLFALSRPLFTQKEQPVIEEKWQSVWVPPGQRAQVTLDDGTTVWLNSRTRLTYPSSFVTDRRIVKLDGEGFFEVEKDPEHPFIVQTGRYDVEVLGTSFNVLAYNDHDLFETALLGGSVQVSPKGGNTPIIQLKPNEKAFGTEGGLQVSRIDNPDHFRWREGLICLDDERFEDLIKKFSLYFDIKIIIQNTTLLDYRCTGKFRQSDGVDYALKVLQAEMKFSYTRDNELNEIVIR